MPNPRNPKNYCSNCSKCCKGSNIGLCRKCKSTYLTIQYGDQKSINDFHSTYDRHLYQNVRHHAHRVMDMLNKRKICNICSYDKYVELCHIKAISDFDKSTKLSIVNHPDNLIYLCPNHHWELDHGQLNLARYPGTDPGSFL
jgi:predicted restriction endonuclease